MSIGEVIPLQYAPASGRRSRYRLTLPAAYHEQPARAFPLLLHFHGWGGDEDEGLAFHHHGETHGYLVASPVGYGDYTRPDAGPYSWASWNGVGTTGTNDSSTCYVKKHHRAQFNGYCYASCGHCQDACWWTTCEDSVAQTLALLREVQAARRVDASRIYATGISNGGVFTYELARDPRTAGVFAGIAPMVGSPHAGFNRGPLLPPLPFLGIWAEGDHTMPPFANPDVQGHPGGPDVALDTRWMQSVGAGWLYTTARATTKLWAVRNGCEAEPEPCGAECLGISASLPSARCVTWPDCAGGAEVTECIHLSDVHDAPPWGPTVLWAFMNRHPPTQPATAAAIPSPHEWAWVAAAGAVGSLFALGLAAARCRRGVSRRGMASGTQLMRSPEVSSWSDLPCEGEGKSDELAPQQGSAGETGERREAAACDGKWPS